MSSIVLFFSYLLLFNFTLLASKEVPKAKKHYRSKSLQNNENTPPENETMATINKSADRATDAGVQVMARVSLDGNRTRSNSRPLYDIAVDALVQAAGRLSLDDTRSVSRKPSADKLDLKDTRVAKVQVPEYEEDEMDAEDEEDAMDAEDEEDEMDDIQPRGEWGDWDFEESDAEEQEDAVVANDNWAEWDYEESDEEPVESSASSSSSQETTITRPQTPLIKKLFFPQGAFNLQPHALTPASTPSGSRRARKIPKSLLALTKLGQYTNQKYVIEGRLGKGSYGTVHRAHLRRNPNRKVAIKVIDVDSFTDDLFSTVCQYLESEIRILKAMKKAPNCLQMVEVYRDVIHSRRISIVTELIEGYSLVDLIDWSVYRRKNGVKSLNSSSSSTSTISSASSTTSDGPLFPVKIIARIVRDLLIALQAMHGKKIAHQDLKSMNIMIRADQMQAILIDFGASHLFEKEEPHQDFQGSLSWMAPEMLFRLGSTVAVDIWSLGGTVIEMIDGDPLIQDLEYKTVRTKMHRLNQLGVDLPRAKGEPLLLDFVRSCLVEDPKQRPTVLDLLRHPFLTQAADDAEMSDFMIQMNELKTIYGGKRPRRPFEDPIHPASRKSIVNHPPRHYKSY